MTIEIVTLGFPIYQIRKHVKAKRAVDQILEVFDVKKRDPKLMGSEHTSMTAPSTRSGKMFPMSSLEECLRSNPSELQAYASGKEFKGENIVFLTKVLHFKQQYPVIFSRAHGDINRARMITFKSALSIFVCYVHTGTAEFPINIESPIYKKLAMVFGRATTLIATAQPESSCNSSISDVTPWAEPPDPATPALSVSNSKSDFPMHSLPSSHRYSNGGESRDLIIPRESGEDDPLHGFIVPGEFNDNVFNEAFESIKFMVWTETWQRFMAMKHRTSTISDT